MKKNKLLVLSVLATIILPVSVFATSNIISTKSKNIDYSKLNYSEEDFINNRNEKAKMQNESLENMPLESSSKTSEEIQKIKSNLDEYLDKADEEVSNEIQYLLDIVREYYPNEVNSILEEAKIEEDEMNKTGKYVEISKAECKLINLVINIINEKNIVEDKKEVLKDYISNQIFKLKEIKEFDLIDKINDALNN